MRRSFLVIAGLALMSLVNAAGADAAEVRPPRNIILIMADDLGRECIGAHGGQSYATPHLDKLAATGARFDYCFAQPLCTPTRVELMTGLYNVRNYVHFGLLDPEQTTFGHVFRKAGFATCIVGKWQLQGGFDGPAHFGFDDYCLWQLTRRPGRYATPGLEIAGREIDYSADKYGPDIVNDYAMQFIERHKDRPFFLYYPMMLTHDPYDPTPDSADWGGKKKAKKDKDDEGKNPHFADMVTYMDKLVGKLVARLDALGLRENTLIIFTGDNGTGRGTRSQFRDRVVIGGKASPTDSGMRVPLIVNGPGVAAGRVSRDLVDMTDFLPTICEAAGVPIPSGMKLDGRSFWPQARGETGHPRPWIYCWYSRDGVSNVAEFARTHDYKLYRDGRFFDVHEEDDDEHPLKDDQLDDSARQVRQSLQAALNQYTDARPEKLRDRQNAKSSLGDNKE